jgi:multidrug efflux pump subunit AcrA (membrane-fusion protein)
MAFVHTLLAVRIGAIMALSKILMPAAGAIILLLTLNACESGKGNTAGPAPTGLPVKTETVQTKKVPDYTEYIATLEARGSAILQPEVEGQITKILVHSGEHVAAGQPLMVIDPRRQEATLNSQEASLKNKQATLEFDRMDLERKRGLYAAGVIPRQDLDQAQTAHTTRRGPMWLRRKPRFGSRASNCAITPFRRRMMERLETSRFELEIGFRTRRR